MTIFRRALFDYLSEVSLAFISIIIFFKAKAEETKVENTVPPTTEKNEIEKPGGEIEVKEQLIVNEVQPEVEGGGT